MKNADIEVMAKVLVALKNYLPVNESKLFDEFQSMYERFNEKNQREKENYQNKADYHRDYTRSWRANNPEKQKQYDADYRTRKKMRGKQPLPDKADEKSSLLENLNEKKRQITEIPDNPSAKNQNKFEEL